MGVIVLVWARKSGGSNGNHQRQGNDEDDSEYGEPAEENKTAYQNFRWLLSGVLFGLACAGVSLFTFGCGRVFSQTGNGYFAIWTMLISSLWYYGWTGKVISQRSRSSADWSVY